MKRIARSMDPLLFLCHRLPFPPNKGDKVRSYHFLAHLAERHRIFLGTFVDDPADWQHVDALAALCADVRIEPLEPLRKRLSSASALWTGDAMTLPYFRSRSLKKWVRETAAREHIERAFTFSSPMAQYVLDLPGIRSVADFVDMDSVKWSDYAGRRAWPASAFYSRESRRLLAYERRVAASVEAITFVTDEESRRFKAALAQGEARIATIRNGVDGDYFSPAWDFASPFPGGELPIVFTGAMDYWPNVDAVTWFARDVLPGIRRREPRACFYIVGMNPDSAVRLLARDPAVRVTGRVEDVRPYIAHAHVVVAPLRVARGIQNKVLEAMAMAKPVVVTPMIATSLSVRHGVEIEIGSDASDYGQRVVDLFDEDKARRMGVRARARVLDDYAWQQSYRLLDELLEGERPGTARRMGPVIDTRVPLAGTASR